MESVTITVETASLGMSSDVADVVVASVRYKPFLTIKLIELFKNVFDRILVRGPPSTAFRFNGIGTQVLGCHLFLVASKFFNDLFKIRSVYTV